MPLVLKDGEGKDVTLPVDKVEDIATLQADAAKVGDLNKQIEELKKSQNPDWPAVRAQIANLERDLDTAKKTPPPAAVPAVAAVGVDENKATELGKKAAEEVLANQRAKDVETEKDRLVAELSQGDANRKKVIEEKYKELTGGQTITDPAVMKEKLKDAEFLASRTRNSAGNGFDRASGGSPGGSPQRQIGGKDIEHGADLARKMGYTPKTADVSKLIK